MSLVYSTRELEVIGNPELHLNQYLQDTSDANHYQIHKMYAFAKVHFKNQIPRNQIESIVEEKFRNKNMNHSNTRKHQDTKKSNESLFHRLPKSIQLKALSAVAPLTESLSYFSKDDS